MRLGTYLAWCNNYANGLLSRFGTSHFETPHSETAHFDSPQFETGEYMLYTKGKALYIEFLSLPIRRKVLLVVIAYVLAVVISLFIQFIQLYMLFRGIL